MEELGLLLGVTGLALSIPFTPQQRWSNTLATPQGDHHGAEDEDDLVDRHFPVSHFFKKPLWPHTMPRISSLGFLACAILE